MDYIAENVTIIVWHVHRCINAVVEIKVSVAD